MTQRSMGLMASVFSCPHKHLSTDNLFSFAQPDTQHSARNDPLSQEALGGSPWPRASGPNGPQAPPDEFSMSILLNHVAF